MAAPEPVSHSGFPDGGGDRASSDDLVLSDISWMLMEEDIDDTFFYRYSDHPALLTAQQPYAQILSEPSSSSDSTTSSADLSPCGAAPGFGQRSMAGALQSDGGGDRSQPASLTGRRGGEAIQSSGCRGAAEQEFAKTNIKTLSAAGEDHDAVANMDMINRALARGMEEAKKFLPANNSLLKATIGKHSPFEGGLREGVAVDVMSMFRGSGNCRGRKNRQHEIEDLEAEIGRGSKLTMQEREDTDAHEMYREIMSYNLDEFTKRMQDLRIAMDSESEKSIRKGAGEVVDLRAMLIRCAQAVAIGDHPSANEILKQIKQHSSLRGDATQRVAHYFAEGLEARFAGTGSLVYQPLMSKQTSVVNYLKAYRLFMAASCLKKVKHVFSNKIIVDAVAGKSKLHVVDYGLQHGLQWPALLHSLANREGGPPEVRCTGIDLPQPGFRPAYHIEKTGELLSNCARQFRVPFKFHAVAAKWETVTPEDINIHPDEVLVVNCECYLDTLMDESGMVHRPSPRDMVLNKIRNMRPNVFIHCALNGTFGVPIFLTRFREALFFYSAHFDILDATIPRDNDVRLLIERELLGRSAFNVIACEGADRVLRPETYKQWHLRNIRVGLRQLPLRAEVVKLVRDHVKDHYHKDFLFDEDHQWLLHGWKGRMLYAMSTWVAEGR